MKKNLVKYKKPLIALVLLVILLAGYFTREKWMSIFSKDSSTHDSDGSTNTNTGTTSNGSIDKNAILSNGSRGASVSELQRLINADLQNHTPTILDYGILTPLVVDGVFGAKTEAALEFVTRGENAVKGSGKKSISINQFIAEQSH